MKFLLPCLLSLPALLGALNWDEAVAEAAQNHPGLKAAAAELRASGADKGSKRSAFLPKLDASADISHSGTGASGDDWGWPAGGADSESGSYGGGLRASWRLFDGFSSLNQLFESGHNYDARLASLAQEEVDTLKQLRLAFIQLLYAEAQLAVSEDIYKRRSLATSYQKLKYEAGRQARWTWTKAEADELDSKWRLEQSRQDLDLAALGLAQALGRDSAQGLRAEGTLDVKKPQDLDLGVLKSLPSLLRLRSQVLAAEARVASARAAHLPSLSAGGGWSYSGGQDWPPLTRSWNLGLSAGFNLFNGGATYYAVSQAEENLASLKEQETEARRAQELALRRAHARALSALSRVSVAEAQLAAARERYETVAKLGEAGRVGYLDLEQAESGLASAQQQGLAIRQEAAHAGAELDAALGMGIRSVEKGKP